MKLLSPVRHQIMGVKRGDFIKMPTYRYKCRQCGYELEKFSSISSYQRELECPMCHGIARLSISGGSGLIFKGSGFYITDYARKKTSSAKENNKKSK